jgi:hypothetical protein
MTTLSSSLKRALSVEAWRILEECAKRFHVV